jgi:hypothetical protein
MSTHFFGIKDWTFSYSHSVGRNEFAGTGFRNPMDLALAANDVAYVVNRSYENRPDGVHMTVCTLNEEYIREFGSHGEGDGEFVWPTSIALDGQGNVYISDEWLNRISVFDKDGKFLGKWGKPGSGDGELNRPSGLAIRGELLDTVITPISHVDIAVLVQAKAPGHIQLARPIAEAAELTQVFPVQLEFLNTVVTRIRHQYRPVTDGQP